MGKLIDDVYGEVTAAWPSARVATLRQFWPELVYVDVSEVAQYVAGLPNDKCMDLDEFPNCAPPWRSFWMEFAVPRRGWSRDEDQYATLPPDVRAFLSTQRRDRLGWMVQAFELRPDTAIGQVVRWVLIADLFCWPPFDFVRSMIVVRQSLMVKPDGALVALEPGSVPADMQQLVFTLLHLGIAATNSNELADVVAAAFADVRNHSWTGHFAPMLCAAKPPATALQVANAMGSAYLVLKFALCFANCSNVTLTTEAVPPSLVHARAARDRAPITRWRILRIGSMSRALSDAMRGTNGGKHALHLCRGHFKRYTEAAPLFGKRTGTWFWHQQMRGNPALGRIAKMYLVGVDDEKSGGGERSSAVGAMK